MSTTGAPDPRPAPPPRCVVFDWGGVILRICRGFEEGCRAAGLPFHPDVVEGDLYHVRRSHSRRYQVGELAMDQFFRLTAETTGGRYSPDDLARVHDAWLLAEYPGVDRLIDELNAIDGVTTAMLSNTNERHWARRGESPYGPAFPTAARIAIPHASHLLGHAKPDAAIYAAFERATGFAGPELLFFDDLPENIAAARDAGWHAHQIDHTGDTAAQMREALRAAGIRVQPA